MRIRDQYKPDRIISVGDFFDLHSFSRWPLNPELHSPNDELDMAIESAQDWYSEFDQIDIVESNHDSRIIKKILGAGLPSRVMREFSEIMHMPPGWQMKELQIEVDGFLILHGDGLNSSSSRNCYNKLKASVAHGHIHSSAHASYSQSRQGRFFSLNTGCLIDVRQKAFDYARFSHERASIGMGFVIDGDEAFYLPMPSKMQNNYS